MYLFLLILGTVFLSIDTIDGLSEYSFQNLLRFRTKSRHQLKAKSNSKDIAEVVNKKQLLQELSQHLFKGANPAYEWKESKNLLRIYINDDYCYNYRLKFDTGQPITNAKRKIVEGRAAARAIENLRKEESIGVTVRSWLLTRLNRENTPRLLKRSRMIEVAFKKKVIVLVDTENVSDFKSHFFIDNRGIIRFSSPLPPALVSAPSLMNNDDYTQDTGGLFRLPTDADILVLSYAHSRSAQAAWANRVTSNYRKDAADAMILFDLGVLYSVPSVKKILLVTGDKFGNNAEACFKNDLDYQSVSNTNSNDLNDLRVDFELVPNCVTASKSVGRLTS